MPSATKPSRTGLRSESFAGRTFRVEVSAEFGLYITGGRCNLSIGELNVVSVSNLKLEEKPDIADPGWFAGLDLPTSKHVTDLESTVTKVYQNKRL